jgi:LPXTG-motif cell wall-anchored protein
MSNTRFGVLAPFAAVLMVSLALVGPAAAEPAGGKGQGTISSTHKGQPASGKSNGKHNGKHNGKNNGAGSKSAVQHDRPNHFQAQADPDGDANGGVDQPGGQGGVDTSAQDGNNGSGNDSDCEDDNRGKGVPGHCKDKPVTQDKPVTKDHSREAAVLGVQATADTVPAGVAVPKAAAPQAADVLGVEAIAGTVPEAMAPETARVLGVEQTAEPTTGILPQTGAAEYLTMLMLAGVGLAAAGALTLLLRRRLQHGR